MAQSRNLCIAVVVRKLLVFFWDTLTLLEQLEKENVGAVGSGNCVSFLPFALHQMVPNTAADKRPDLTR